MREPDKLIPKHGGYRHLKSFQVAQLVYDVTVRFCERYIERRSRTRDQVTQAARSGAQNIAEGSQASGTSKKFELKRPASPEPAWRSFGWTMKTSCDSAACHNGRAWTRAAPN